MWTMIDVPMQCRTHPLSTMAIMYQCNVEPIHYEPIHAMCTMTIMYQCNVEPIHYEPIHAMWTMAMMYQCNVWNLSIMNQYMLCGP